MRLIRRSLSRPRACTILPTRSRQARAFAMCLFLSFAKGLESGLLVRDSSMRTSLRQSWRPMYIHQGAMPTRVRVLIEHLMRAAAVVPGISRKKR